VAEGSRWAKEVLTKGPVCGPRRVPRLSKRRVSVQNVPSQAPTGATTTDGVPLRVPPTRSSVTGIGCSDCGRGWQHFGTG
jgi:hypothetical protein